MRTLASVFEARDMHVRGAIPLERPVDSAQESVIERPAGYGVDFVELLESLAKIILNMLWEWVVVDVF